MTNLPPVWYHGDMKIALTGHRSEDCRSEEDVRTRIRGALSSAPEPIEAVITGMANGVDLWGGAEALDLGLPVIAAKPWRGHGPRVEDTALYERILVEAVEVVYVDSSMDYRGPWVYQKRNIWMVDNATHVCAYYSGKGRGGTYNCLQYAYKVLPEDHIRNVYDG